jgi:hypothetical protein
MNHKNVTAPLVCSAGPILQSQENAHLSPCSPFGVNNILFYSVFRSVLLCSAKLCNCARTSGDANKLASKNLNPEKP